MSLPAYVHPLAAPDGPLPEAFTYPFRYEPHPLCRAAATVVQARLHALGVAEGKMFGVLVASADAEGCRPDPQPRTPGHGCRQPLCFLAAYSGQLDGTYAHPWFVPPVLDYLAPDGHFMQEQRRIERLGQRLAAADDDPERRLCHQELCRLRTERQEAAAAARERYLQGKARRDARRLSPGADTGEMVRESQRQKADIRRARQLHARRIAGLEQRLSRLDAARQEMADERRRRSEELQQWLFTHFVVGNARGERRHLAAIFAGQPIPAGAGECCAPKLLNAAYALGLRPLAMAEFWWQPLGATFRSHLTYYPACQRKCRPILDFMLQGLTLQPDPAAHYDRLPPPLRVVWEDEWLAVVAKPAGWLSVPGKGGRPSVAGEARRMWPELEGPGVVHRLDMDTSGLLLVAKTLQAHHHLQAQFEHRQVWKRYIAELDGELPLPASAEMPPGPRGLSPSAPPAFPANPAGFPAHPAAFSRNPAAFSRNPADFAPEGFEGEICLPLCPDFDDLPRQRVDVRQGAEAVTRYRVVARGGGRTRVAFFPLTGRTHQLRVHAAAGLGLPIVGDRLYGRVADRLHLHAEMLAFRHPKTGRLLHFELPAPF